MQDFTAFDLDEFVAGKSKGWTFWNCEPSTFPWDYGAVEHAYILQGKFSVQYEGADPVTLVAGDFVRYCLLEVFAEDMLSDLPSAAGVTNSGYLAIKPCNCMVFA